MLQGKTRDHRRQKRVVDREFGAQSIGEPRLFDGDVLPDQLQLFTKTDFIRAMAAERRPQYFAQAFDDADSGLTLVVANENGDRVERIEQEVRIDLRLQRGETRAGELFGKSGHLRVALVRFNKVTNRMLNADH